MKMKRLVHLVVFAMGLHLTSVGYSGKTSQVVLSAALISSAVVTGLSGWALSFPTCDEIKCDANQELMCCNNPILDLQNKTQQSSCQLVKLDHHNCATLGATMPPCDKKLPFCSSPIFGSNQTEFLSPAQTQKHYDVGATAVILSCFGVVFGIVGVGLSGILLGAACI